MTQPQLTKLELWGQANAYNEGRAYRHPVSGKQYPSITTILKMVDKSGMAQWAADQAVEWCVENAHLLLTKSQEQGKKAARFRWKDVANERAEVGTGVHEYIEAEHTGSWETPELDAEQLLIIEEWYKLNQEHDIVPVHSELTMSNEFDGWMGTADGVWLIDGVLTIVDTKTSKNTWPEHRYQLAALRNATEWHVQVGDMEWETIPAEKLPISVVHLRAPEYDQYGRLIKPGKHEIIPIENPDLYYTAFMAYRDAWYAVKEIEAAEKAAELAGF